MVSLGNNQVFLFGGYDGTNFIGDTWVYSFSDCTWTEVATPNSPPLRWGAAMAYLDDGEVLLFGGDWAGDPADSGCVTWRCHHIPESPLVSVAYPNGGEILTDSATITWTATDPDPGETGLLDIDLEYSDNGGGSWSAIDSNQTNDGSYLWDISGLPDGSEYLVRVTATDMHAKSDLDASDAVFYIDNIPESPEVTVSYPNGGETLIDSATIRWIATDPDPGDSALLAVELDYSTNAGFSWSPISVQWSEDFEDGVVPPNGWTVYDNDYDGDTWMIWEYGSGAPSGVYVALTGGTTCDDWLITPRILCTAGTQDTVSFWATSGFGVADFDVRISTTGNDIGDFGPPVYSVTDHPTSWQEHKIPLDAYDNNNIYVSVVCPTVDLCLLYVDDFTGSAIFEPNDGAYLWDISPRLPYGSDYLIRVSMTDTAGLSDSDTSDAVFTIQPQDFADDWTQHFPLSNPLGRYGHDMAYIGSDQVLLFGGTSGWDETWVYDLSTDTWTQMTPTGNPPETWKHGMAYMGGDQVLLFGGETGGGYSNETWVYDLSENTWTQMTPPTSPDPRYSHAMAYIGSNHALLFGGDKPGPPTVWDDTWVYNIITNTWTQMTPALNPSGRIEHAMVYIGGDQVLLFGGTSGSDETWVYDLSADTWTQMTPATSPLRRYEHAMAYIGEDRVLLFGGYDGSWIVYDDTWVYDLSENDWIQDANAIRPSARRFHGLSETSMDYSSYPVLFGCVSENDETWIFGGGDYLFANPPVVTVTHPNGGEILADSVIITWTATDPDPGDSALLVVDLDYSDNAGSSWSIIDSNQTNDGSYLWDISELPHSTSCLVRATVIDTADLSASDTSDAVFTICPADTTDDWTQKSPSPKPGARYAHSMAYIGGDQVLLFGGYNGAYDDETWIYDLSDSIWTQISPAASPSARDYHAMAFIGEDQVLLFGGYDGTSNDETWIYDLSETSWTQQNPASKPSARRWHIMAYIGGDQVLLFGGDAYNNETWAYDLSESTWMQMSPIASPSGRGGHDMAFLGGDQVLLFGGHDGAYDDETWVYDLSESTWTQKSPASSPSARRFHKMAYIGGDQVLLFGGFDGARDDETWIYDLSVDNWTEDLNSISPSARDNHGLSETSMDGSSYAVLFGGYDDAFDDETWTFGGGDYLIPPENRPAAVTDLAATLAGNNINLSWTAVTTDTTGKSLVVDLYRIYRDTVAYFFPGSDPFDSTVDTLWMDDTGAVGDTEVQHYYAVTAVAGGKESAFSGAVGEFDRELGN
jgi:N-acetylneuraminic acid mutarotase